MDTLSLKMGNPTELTDIVSKLSVWCLFKPSGGRVRADTPIDRRLDFGFDLDCDFLIFGISILVMAISH